MRFQALACDFDGTLATADRLVPAAAAALAQARAAGVRVILVTGRTFFDLTRICAELDLFDVVVAENGAVLYFPASAMICDQGPAPPARLLAELDRRELYYHVGRVIVGTARQDEVSVRAALAAAGASHEVVYNRSSLMLLPGGVSKGSGLERALAALGLSFHDVLGIGDAENDLALFEACGWAACPGDATPEVLARADWVFPGDDGEAVARGITGPVLEGRLPVERSPRHRLPLGWVVETSEPVSIPARGVNVLVHGDPLSGKSWLAGSLVERLIEGRYTACVIDPEGDYRVLERLPGVSWVEGGDGSGVVDALDRIERDPSAAVVVDVSALAHDDKVRVVGEALRAVRELRRRRGRPHWVVLDEAHYFLHEGGIADAAAGIEDKGFCLVTYRPSWMRPAVVRATDVFVLAHTEAPSELACLRRRLGGEPGMGTAAIGALVDLPAEEFVAVQHDGAGAWTAATFVARRRETMHVRHRKKYADTRVAADRRFLFRDPGGRVVAEADSLYAFRRAVAAAPAAVLGEHATRGDFSRWVLGVFSDDELGRQIGKTEARWRRGEITDLRSALERLIAFRYGAEA